MIKFKVPKRLWDDCLEVEAYIHSHTLNGHPSLKGETPETVVSGEMADISEFAEHAFYDWVRFRDVVIPFPEDKLVLGQYLGPSTDIGPAMSAKILKINGQVVHRSTFRALTHDKMNDPKEKEEWSAFDARILQQFGEPSTSSDFQGDLGLLSNEQLYQGDDKLGEGTPDRDNIPDDYIDQYLNAEVLLPKGDSMMTGTVKRRKVDDLNIPTGQRNSNPILDTRTYVIEFPDGSELEYSANTIAKNMRAQCDIEGNQ
jgi:hypothetical protein